MRGQHGSIAPTSNSALINTGNAAISGYPNLTNEL